MNEDELFLIERLKKGDKKIFSFLFSCYYKDLVMFCGNYLPNLADCEDIVQSLFLKLWENRENIVIHSSLKSYLLSAVRNACFNEKRSENRINRLYDICLEDKESLTSDYVLYSDLYSHYKAALDSMPGTYRKPFFLSREKKMKYTEIARILHVSVRTVEVRIGKALQFLRNELKHFYLFFM